MFLIKSVVFWGVTIKVGIAFFFVGFSSLAAATTAQPGEAELIRALDAMHEIKELSDKSTLFGADQSEDDKMARKEVARLGSIFPESLRRASDLGNPVAKYYLSAYVDRVPGDYVQNKEESCKLLDEAAENGLLAAAVKHIYTCDEGFKRWRYDDGEHLKLVERLKKEMAKDDINKSWYPLPITAGLCFPPPPMIEVKGLPLPMLGVRLTTYEEFQAEANMILASSNPKISVDEKQAYLRKAASLKCDYASEIM